MKLVHSRKIDQDRIEFLEDLRATLDEFISASVKDSSQRAIYKVCTAAFTTLEGCSEGNVLLLGAGGAVRRCAAMAAIRQVSLAKVQLRRLIECAVWYVYFVDHPVEFEEFCAHPERGWGVRGDSGPIESVACSNPAWFAKYASERFKGEPSGEAGKAIGILNDEYGKLSADVHAAKGAIAPGGSLALSHDRYDGGIAEQLRNLVTRVVRSAILAIAAIDINKLRWLDAINRAWFDELVGVDVAKAIRAGEFGVPRTQPPASDLDR